MSGHGLREWFEKHQETQVKSSDKLPSGEPGYSIGVEVKKPQDGGKLAGVGKLDGAVDSLATEIGDVEPVTTEDLSEANGEISSEPAEGPHDSEGTDIGDPSDLLGEATRQDSEGTEIGSSAWATEEPARQDSEETDIGDVSAVAAEDLSRKSIRIDDDHARAILLSRLRRGPPDITVGVGVKSPPPPLPEPITKSAGWSIGMVHYSESEDDRIAGLLEKSEGFFDRFQAPVRTFDKPIQKSEPCFMCKSMKPIVLTTCPHCGAGAPLEKAATSVQVRGVSEKRMLRREQDLVLPRGACITDL